MATAQPAPTPSSMNPSATVRPDRSHPYLSFLRAFVRAPFVVAAVAPSSPALSREMVRGLDLRSARAVVEFGPGTGAFTDALVPLLGPATTYFAIDISPVMGRMWRERHPGLTLVEGSVGDVARICRDMGVGPVNGVGQVDCIISGLPWASFPDELQIQTLRGVREVLRPGGVMVTFGYHIGTWLPLGKRFYKRLPEYFTSITRTGYQWTNIPPAFVVRCTA